MVLFRLSEITFRRVFQNQVQIHYDNENDDHFDDNGDDYDDYGDEDDQIQTSTMAFYHPTLRIPNSYSSVRPLVSERPEKILKKKIKKIKDQQQKNLQFCLELKKIIKTNQKSYQTKLSY